MQLSPRHLGAAAIAVVSAVSLAAGSLAATATVDDGRASTYRAKAATDNYVKLDLLAINDFHGNLEPPTGSSGRIGNTPAGGAAYLATVLKEERAKSRAAGARPITVAAGDLIGASPLLSAAFYDEPAIEALNKTGLQVASVGNHEFDEGVRELRRMQKGGCRPDGDDPSDGSDSCPDGSFAGAAFRYLGANVVWKRPENHRRPTAFPATKVMEVQGEKVAFVGMTLEDTDQIVSQAGIKNVDFTDEVETANAIVPKLKKRGIESIIVLLHEGIDPAGDRAAYNDCTGAVGPALAIAENLKPAIDAVVSGHTHQPYNCVVKDPKGNNRLLTSASSFGRMVTKLHFLIDPRSGDIVRPAAFAENTIVENGSTETPAAGLLRLIDRYKTLVAPIANAVIGHIAPLDTRDTMTRTADPDGGDSPLGNLIADSQKADDSIVTPDGRRPVIAFMNSGGIRTDLVENENRDITYEAAFAVQPFNNLVTSMNLTGQQIIDLLNEQWNGGNEGDQLRILQVSGLSYTWDKSLAAEPETNAIVGDVMVDADGDSATPMIPLVPGTTYRVAANNFIADGGDRFATFRSGSERINGGLDIDALREFLAGHDPVAPTPTDRISSVD